MDLPMAAFGLATAHVLGRLANRVFRRLVKPSSELLEGFPRWRWQLSVTTQALVFPGLMLLAWLTSGRHVMLHEWLLSSAWGVSRFERWYVYALFASQTRDMFPMPAGASFLMKLHHWVVVIACLLSLCVPQGFGLFVLGSFVLELGSLFYNLRTLYPDSTAVSVLYQACMLASNIAAVAVGVLMLQTPGIPAWMKGLYFVADVGVCLGRQRHALKDAGIIKKKEKAIEPPGSSPPPRKPPSATAASAARRGVRGGRTRGLKGSHLVVGVPLLVGRGLLGARWPWRAAPEPPAPPRWQLRIPLRAARGS